MALSIILIIFGVILISFGIILIVLTEYDEGEIIGVGMFILVVGIVLSVIGINGVKAPQQSSIKPIEYKQVITTKPTLGKTVSNKDTIIYVTDTTYIQKN